VSERMWGFKSPLAHHCDVSRHPGHLSRDIVRTCLAVVSDPAVGDAALIRAVKTSAGVHAPSSGVDGPGRTRRNDRVGSEFGEEHFILWRIVRRSDWPGAVSTSEGNVERTSGYYGISRQHFHTWMWRYEGERRRAARPLLFPSANRRPAHCVECRWVSAADTPRCSPPRRQYKRGGWWIRALSPRRGQLPGGLAQAVPVSPLRYGAQTSPTSTPRPGTDRGGTSIRRYAERAVVIRCT
jgi:hypothetical protein